MRHWTNSMPVVNFICRRCRISSIHKHIRTNTHMNSHVSLIAMLVTSFLVLYVSFAHFVKCLNCHRIYIRTYTYAHMSTFMPTVTFVWIIQQCTHVHRWRSVLRSYVPISRSHACFRTNTCKPVKMAPKAYTAHQRETP